MKRFLSAVLAVALLLCTLPAAFAASDIENHWAKPYLLEMNEIGVINPSSEGEYTPDQAIRRWEFMRYIDVYKRQSKDRCLGNLTPTQRPWAAAGGIKNQFSGTDFWI